MSTTKIAAALFQLQQLDLELERLLAEQQAIAQSLQGNATLQKARTEHTRAQQQLHSGLQAQKEAEWALEELSQRLVTHEQRYCRSFGRMCQQTFDRSVKWRNRIEIAAALVVAGFFAYAGWIQHNAIERAGCAIVVAGALYIIYYIRRNGGEPPDPNPDQTIEAYQRAMVSKFDHQILLLKNVKYW